MTVLVTGAAGFLGSHLCRHLAGCGIDTIAMDRNAPPMGFPGPGVRFVRADLREPATWREALHGVETVFHLASMHLQIEGSESEYRSVNVDATVALAEACVEEGVSRFVHTSTVGIYGHVTNPPASEDAPRCPTNTYERTKLEGEEALRVTAHRLGFDLRILRPAWIYGPGCPRTRKLLRVIRRRRFFYVGNGSNLRHPVFIADMLDALMAAAERAPGLRSDHIIAGPTPMTLREMVDACAAALEVAPPTLRIPRRAGLLLGSMAETAGALVGKEPPFSRRSLAFFENDNAFDGTAAARDLAFRPRVDFAEGLRRTIEDGAWLLP
jgi:dihydroflavonol-4-reductase